MDELSNENGATIEKLSHINSDFQPNFAENERLAGAWRRCLARFVDGGIFSLIPGFLLVVLLLTVPATMTGGVQKLLMFLCLVFCILLEGVCYALTKTTPGKSLLGIRVLSKGGKPTSATGYASRLSCMFGSVYLFGLVGIFPRLSLVTALIQFIFMWQTKGTSYDNGLHLTVVSKPLSKLRIMTVACVILTIVGSCIWFEQVGSNMLSFERMRTETLELCARAFPLAQNQLGIRYLNGVGVSKDPKRAEMLFRKAAQRGIPIAWFNLALSLQGDPTRVTEMTNALRQGAIAGSPLAEFSYACVLAEQSGAWTPEAMKWLQQAQQHGIPEAYGILQSLQQ